jgi:DNA polymerase-3 subunit beta
MPAAALIEAVRRVSLVADRASPVRLTFGAGTVAIEAQTEGRARAMERVTASFHGDEPAIAFNPHYLLDGITAAAAGPARHAARDEENEPAGPDRESPAGSATVRLQFTSPARPALITLAGDDGEDGNGPDAGDPRAEGQARPAFRYLVVPLRSPVRG